LRGSADAPSGDVDPHGEDVAVVTLIEYCLNNVDAGARRALAGCGLEVRERPCMQRCGKCYEGPFLVIDGELKEGGTHHGILRRVLADPGNQRERTD
jgi:uncharacterized protein YuzB (UPF0349 family)